MHSTSSKHSSLRGHDPKRDLNRGFSQVTAAERVSPPTRLPWVLQLPWVHSWDTHPAGNQHTCSCSCWKPVQSKGKVLLQPGQFPDPAKGKASTRASITETGRRGHAAMILGEDRTASAWWWWSLPSQAAFYFNTPRADNIFPYFPKLEFLGKATVNKSFC